jgi:hypothetical protein
MDYVLVVNNGPVDGRCSYCAPAQPQSSGFGHEISCIATTNITQLTSPKTSKF